jgi:diguanylate cyclase
VFSFIFIVAVLNLGVGFALAVYAGQRHRLLTELGVGLPGNPSLAIPQRTAVPPPVDLPADQPAAEVPPPEADAPADRSAAATPAVAPPAAADSQASPDDAPSAAPPAETPPSPSEQCVADFQAEVESYREQVTQANEALRSYMGTADPSDIEACLQSLMAATNEYLDRRQQVQEGFAELHSRQPQLAAVSAELQSAMQQQDAEIEHTTKSIENFDYGALVENGPHAVVGQTSKLLDSSNRLRDTLDEAMLEVQRSENRLTASPANVQIDRLTGLLNRTGLEAELARWWQADPQRTRALSAAMIDLDQLAEINDRFGHMLGDALLRAIAKLLDAEKRGNTAIGRISGQRFFVLFFDTDVRSATNSVERIRQMIEFTVLEHRQGEIRLTVSCGVTANAADDTSETLMERAEATLREAKRYGRNRTFLHEGKFPTPVVPPNFALEPRRITL